jgi:hypothetical protein
MTLTLQVAIRHGFGKVQHVLDIRNFKNTEWASAIQLVLGELCGPSIQDCSSFALQALWPLATEKLPTAFILPSRPLPPPQARRITALRSGARNGVGRGGCR